MSGLPYWAGHIDSHAIVPIIKNVKTHSSPKGNVRIEFHTTPLGPSIHLMFPTKSTNDHGSAIAIIRYDIQLKEQSCLTPSNVSIHSEKFEVRISSQSNPYIFMDVSVESLTKALENAYHMQIKIPAIENSKQMWVYSAPKGRQTTLESVVYDVMPLEPSTLVGVQLPCTAIWGIQYRAVLAQTLSPLTKTDRATSTFTINVNTESVSTEILPFGDEDEREVIEITQDDDEQEREQSTKKKKRKKCSKGSSSTPTILSFFNDNEGKKKKKKKPRKREARYILTVSHNGPDKQSHRRIQIDPLTRIDPQNLGLNVDIPYATIQFLSGYQSFPEDTRIQLWYFVNTLAVIIQIKQVGTITIFVGLTQEDNSMALKFYDFDTEEFLADVEGIIP